LTARQLIVRRGGKQILQGVDFAASSGELVGVLGPSGSGKSTLLFALSGFRPADQGKVLLDGKDLVEGFEALKADVGFVPQDDIVPTALRVERVLHYAAELRLGALSEEVRRGRIEGVLVKLGLNEHRRKRVAQLSGGQRKRVNVAVELLSRPDLLFADEPTSGLDPALEHDLTTTLKQMAAEGRIVIVTTHVMTSLDLLDQIYLISDGHLAWCGPPDALKPYFGVDDFHKVYRVLAGKTGAEWRDRFRASDDFRRHLGARLGGRG